MASAKSRFAQIAAAGVLLAGSIVLHASPAQATPGCQDSFGGSYYATQCNSGFAYPYYYARAGCYKITTGAFVKYVNGPKRVVGNGLDYGMWSSAGCGSGNEAWTGETVGSTTYP